MSAEQEVGYTNDIADKIADSIINSFNKLPAKGKPKTRSNGVKEWTVLAGIVLINENEIEPLTLATGVKSLPDKIISTLSNGSMVHDSHAEILSMRLLNRFLIEECLELTNDIDYNSRVLEKSADNKQYNFCLKKGLKFGMYITEPPCGDASMTYLSSNTEIDEHWQEEDLAISKKRKLADEMALSITRGRSNFAKLGVVRTKPGRRDSPATFSKSCSDKLCMTQLTSLLNSVSSSLIDPSGIHLDYLVMNSNQVATVDFERCFYDRFTNKIQNEGIIHKMKILGCNEKEKYPFFKNDESEPCAISLMSILTSKTVECLNNGVKDGSYSKNKPVKRHGESIVCRKRLYEQAKPLIHIHQQLTYLKWKEENNVRQKLKRLGRDILGDWVCTSADDFEI